MGSLIEAIQKALAGAGNSNGFGGGGQAQSAMPSFGGGQSGGFNSGLMAGMANGNSSGRGKLDTSASDHALGMSALGHYQDMSNPAGEMQGLMALNSLGRQQPWKVQSAAPANDYVQFLMSRMR